MTTPTFIRRLRTIALAVASITSIAFLSAGIDNPQGAAQAPGVRFRAEQIAADFGVGYAVVTADVNGDGRPDVLAINATDLVWFEAPSWQKHVMLAGATVRDNVTLAPHDIDGDGRIDVALGAGWTGANTGTLQWVRQGAPGASPAWEMFRDCRGADAPPDQVGGRRRRSPPRAHRRAAARSRHQRAELGRSRCATADLPAAGQSADGAVADGSGQ